MRLLALLVLVAGHFIAAQNTTQANSTPSAVPSATGNTTSIANSTSVANSTRTANATQTGNHTTAASTSTGNASVVIATTPAEFTNTAITALAPGASGTVASGPDDRYIAAAGRLVDSRVVGGAGALVLGLALLV